MMLNALTTLSVEALPLAELRAHLRMGTGFAESDLQEPILASCLRASLETIEGRIDKALITRRFQMVSAAWQGGSLALPLAPVSAVQEVSIVRPDGSHTALATESWFLEPDQHRPRLHARSGAWPMLPLGGALEVVFDAGFGENFEDLPADLAQAVLLLAAQFYEYRHEGGQESNLGALPHRVAGLIERWRAIRLLGGGAR